MERRGISRLIGVLAALVAIVVLTGCSKANPKPRVDFSLLDLDGHKMSLGQVRGKVVLVDFWATWCAPCREEVPALIRLQKRYGPRGFTVLGLSMDDDADKVRAFREEKKINYPVAMADLATTKAFGGVLGLPVLFLIRRDGSVAARHEGALAVMELEKAIEGLL